MKYKKVRPNSYNWEYVLYAMWGLGMLGSVILWKFGETNTGISGATAMLLLAVIYIAVCRKQISEAKKISRSIHKHIEKNELCQMEYDYNRVRFYDYPNVWWKLDKKENILYIRFALDGGKVDFHGMEKKLEERLKRPCINVYEEYGIIEYLFEYEAEKQVKIHSVEDVVAKYGDTKIPLSQSFVWDYRKSPHCLVSGNTGVGKTTFACYLMSALLKAGLRIVYIDIKRDMEMMRFCKNHLMIKYVYEPSEIVNAMNEIMEEFQLRAGDINEIGLGEDFEYGFNPVLVVVDEVVLLKLALEKKVYEEIFKSIEMIIASGRSKAIYCCLITQSSLAEYLGNTGMRDNMGLRVLMGHATPRETAMVFGEDHKDVKNRRYGEVGTGLIMRKGVDSRPREFLAPFIENGALDS